MSDWKNRNVLVTGATGLLGSWLAKSLLAEGARVVCLVRDQVTDCELHRSGDISRCVVVRGRLTDLELLLRALNEHEIDSVFHLGAQTIVPTALRSPISTFESNVRGTWLLLEACRLLDGTVERIVVASSDKAYGEQKHLPYREDAPLDGQYPYDASKACAELVARSYHRTYGLPIAVSRCGNLYGGGDLNYNRIVPGTIRSLLLGERPIIRSDGTYVRDYFYVRDAAAALLALGSRVSDDGITGEAFNFGNSTPVTVLELVETISAVVGRPDLEPKTLGEASGEIRAQYLDCAKSRERLGFEPGYDLERGLAETADWYRVALGGG